jgi:hypothetical protein
MVRNKKVLVTRGEIARAGGVRAAFEEALSLAGLGMTPRAMTAYEAVGMEETDADGAGILVQVEVGSEAELREAIVAGAEAVLIVGEGVKEVERLTGIARGLRGDCLVEAAGAAWREEI